MIGRVFLVLICGGIAVAQLPPAQAPAPKSEIASRERARKADAESAQTAHVDAVVSDAQGRPLTGLQAADFAIQVDGKPEKIETCEYRAGQPLHLVVIVDDLSLSLAHLNEARRELRTFVATLRPSDEAAILRTGSGVGALDRITSDKAELDAAITRASYNPESAVAPATAFTAGALGLVRSALEGLLSMPGRKSVLLISERLRDPARGGQTGWSVRLTPLANRASAVFYAVDMDTAVEQPLQLDQGVADVAKDTGGEFLDRGRLGVALSRLASDQSGYYVLSYRAEDLPYDFIAGVPRVTRLALATPAREARIRARNGVFGGADGSANRELDDDFQHDIESELIGGDFRVALTGLAEMQSAAWQVTGLIHIDTRELTYTRSLDGRYVAKLDLGLALFGETGASVKAIARSVDVTVGEQAYQYLQRQGFDYTITLAVPQPGSYQLRAAARDSVSGKLGTARQFLSVDWGAGKLSMSSIVLHGEVEKNASGAEVVKDPEETNAVRSFKAGHKFTYSCDLFNLAADPQKNAAAEVRALIWRDGALILEGSPMAVVFAADRKGRERVSGIVTLKDQITPGHYVFGLTVTDKFAPHTARSFMDFDVRP
jgi:VWFA-related protein